MVLGPGQSTRTVNIKCGCCTTSSGLHVSTTAYEDSALISLKGYVNTWLEKKRMGDNKGAGHDHSLSGGEDVLLDGSGLLELGLVESSDGRDIRLVRHVEKVFGRVKGCRDG